MTKTLEASGTWWEQTRWVDGKDWVFTEPISGNALRKLLHGWYQGWFLSCQDIGAHLSWLMHWAWHSHTHGSASLSVQPGSHLISLLPPSCPGTVTPGAAVLHMFLVAHGGESGHTLWLPLLAGHTFHLPRHCWASSPDASPHLCHHDTTISFIYFENDICCWYGVKLPSIYNIELPAFPTITSLVLWNSLFPGIWLCLTLVFYLASGTECPVKEQY